MVFLTHLNMWRTTKTFSKRFIKKPSLSGASSCSSILAMLWLAKEYQPAGFLTYRNVRSRTKIFLVLKLLCVTNKSALIRSDFVMELVTHKNKLQDLGALDKEALVIGGFFFYPHIFLSQECQNWLEPIIRTQLWWRNGSVRGFTNR